MQVESRSQSLPDQAAVPGEVKDLQAELQDTLKALQQHQHDPVNTLDDDKVQRITFQLDFFFLILLNKVHLFKSSSTDCDSNGNRKVASTTVQRKEDSVYCLVKGLPCLSVLRRNWSTQSTHPDYSEISVKCSEYARLQIV